MIYLVWYTIPMQFFAIHGDRLPEDAVPAHLRGHVCGEGHKYACPGPGVPIVRGVDGVYITPENTVVGLEKLTAD